MSERLTVHYKNEPIYDIVIHNSFNMLPDEISKLNVSNKKLCIVTETTVGPIYAEEIKSLLTDVAKEVHIFTFEAGECNKNLDVVKSLYEFLIVNHFDRSDMLIALGGGVVGDLTGYTAATYLRGIDFVQIPTSLLSQVDSSVGGKTGVDFDSYKNMVGAFHQPKLVYTNISTLKTLTKRQYLSGLGEVVKAGLIKDAKFYEWLKYNSRQIINYNDDALTYLVLTSCNIKRLVVENDFKEKGERALLNFGHTLGHAIEKLMNFELLHGECVSLGMVAAAYISCEKNLISKLDYNDIINTLKSFELPVTEKDFDTTQVVEATKSDKKMKAGVVSFVVLNKLGQADIDREVSLDLMAQSLKIVKDSK